LAKIAAMEKPINHGKIFAKYLHRMEEWRVEKFELL
jgi:hypothetical protein